MRALARPALNFTSEQKTSRGLLKLFTLSTMMRQLAGLYTPSSSIMTLKIVRTARNLGSRMNGPVED